MEPVDASRRDPVLPVALFLSLSWGSLFLPASLSLAGASGATGPEPGAGSAIAAMADAPEGGDPEEDRRFKLDLLQARGDGSLGGAYLGRAGEASERGAVEEGLVPGGRAFVVLERDRKGFARVASVRRRAPDGGVVLEARVFELAPASPAGDPAPRVEVPAGRPHLGIRVQDGRALIERVCLAGGAPE